MFRRSERKERAVSFRISRREYEHLLKLAEESGFESVSEFLRCKLQQLLDLKSGDIQLTDDQLVQELVQIKIKMQQLEQLITVR